MSKTEARIVDQTLVISAANAQTPSLWRGDLDAYKSANFSVSVLKTKSSLKVQLSDGKAETIADYADEEKANAALATVTEALFASGSVRKPASFGRKVLMFFQIIFFATLATYLTMIIYPKDFAQKTLAEQPSLTSGSSAPQQSTITAPAREDVGKPVSANDFFAN